MRTKAIEGCVGYFVTDAGDVLSYKQGKRKVLRGGMTNWGYRVACLYEAGTRHYPLIHRLVAKAFVPNPENKPQVNHLDGNKMNNCACNLKWVTQSENQVHAVDTGLKKGLKGEASPAAKLEESQIVEIRKLVKAGETQRSVAALFGMSPTNICNIVNRKRWSHVT